MLVGIQRAFALKGSRKSLATVVWRTYDQHLATTSNDSIRFVMLEEKVV